MNTKKLNAGIAFLCLQNIYKQGVIPEDLLLQITNLADQPEITALQIEGTSDLEVIKQSIALIRDYIRSVSTEISIGDRVEALEDNPEGSVDNYYDKGEVGIVTYMMDNSCVVNFGQSEWDSSEVPFSYLKKVVE